MNRRRERAESLAWPVQRAERELLLLLKMSDDFVLERWTRTLSLDRQSPMPSTWTRRTRRCCQRRVRVWPTSAERRRRGRPGRGSWKSRDDWHCYRSDESSRLLVSTSRSRPRKATTSTTTPTYRSRRKFPRASLTRPARSSIMRNSERLSTRGSNNLRTSAKWNNRRMGVKASARRRTRSQEDLRHPMQRLHRCRGSGKPNRAASAALSCFQHHRSEKLSWKTLSRWV
jgi:hypothetical protein